MKTRALISVFTLVLASILLAPPSPAQATAPEPLTITADLWLTGENSAAGTFGSSGLFSDSGAASQVFYAAGNTIHGVKTLQSANGTITIHFQAQSTWTSPTTAVAEGRFVIVSGTGAYETLHGVGLTHAEIDLTTYHISATYTGEAHFD